MDVNIYSEISKLYEKHAKEKFDEIKSEELISLKQKSYDKYYQDSLKNLEEINTSKIEMDCKNLEGEIINKVAEIDNLEEMLRNLVLKSDEGMNVGNFGYPEQSPFKALQPEPDPNSNSMSNYFSTYSQLRSAHSDIKNKVQNIGKQLDTLCLEPVESIKKAKKAFDNYNSQLALNLSKTLMEKGLQLNSITEERNKKFKSLEEKKQTSINNEKKVLRLKKEVEDNNERYFKEESENKEIQMEIARLQNIVSENERLLEKLEGEVVKKGSKNNLKVSTIIIKHFF
jgi:hypothetical protein